MAETEFPAFTLEDAVDHLRGAVPAFRTLSGLGQAVVVLAEHEDSEALSGIGRAICQIADLEREIIESSTPSQLLYGGAVG